MPLGRIDADTTANVGIVEGGTATNVVAERCSIRAEARSRDERSLAGQLTAMLDAMTWAASEAEVDLETRVDNEFTGYRRRGARSAGGDRDAGLAGVGYKPRWCETGGGSDVNAFMRNGLPAVNLCNGMIDIHTPDERIAVRQPGRLGRGHAGLIGAARAVA